MQQEAAAPSSTRTTDDLFSDELFKFKTQTGVELNPLDYVDLGYSDLFESSFAQTGKL